MPRFRLFVLFLVVVVAVQFGNCSDCSVGAPGSDTTSLSFFELIAKGLMTALDTSGEDVAEENSIGAVFDRIASKISAIFPGTLWCGSGTKAKQEKDLGIFSETDACCRTHDNCQNNVLAGETKVNLNNNGIFTRSACTCDNAFYNCLKNVNDWVSNSIGKTYFNILSPQCFRCKCPTPDCNRTDGTECKDRCAKYEWVNSKTY